MDDCRCCDNFLVMFLPGIWEGKQRRKKKKYLEKLQAEQQMAEDKGTLEKKIGTNKQKRNEEIDNPTTSLTNMEQKKIQKEKRR